MSELRFLLDPTHEDKELFKEYAESLGDHVRGGFLEMKRCKELENRLKEYDSTITFLKDRYEFLLEKRKVFPIIIYVLDFVIEKKLDFWMAGLDEKEIKLNMEEIISENDFKEGLYFFVIGKYHEDFVRKTLEPLFKKKFDKVTYYKSSS
jgi:hypothetical protein